jgi:hypothetical protein
MSSKVMKNVFKMSLILIMPHSNKRKSDPDSEIKNKISLSVQENISH